MDITAASPSLQFAKAILQFQNTHADASREPNWYQRCLELSEILTVFEHAIEHLEEPTILKTIRDEIKRSRAAFLVSTFILLLLCRDVFAAVHQATAPALQDGAVRPVTG